jgi:histidinol-phosphate/aromatic aminotransferase/cobyric acid decarboxylase-like protein
MQLAQPPWNVNTYAQLAGCVALREGQGWRAQTLAQLNIETEKLRARLSEAGYRPHPTTVNYFLVPVISPAVLRAALLREHIVVRDCTSFGLPNHIRIATQLPEANDRLVQALAALAPAHLPGG